MIYELRSSPHFDTFTSLLKPLLQPRVSLLLYHAPRQLHCTPVRNKIPAGLQSDWNIASFGFCVKTLLLNQ